MNIERGSLYIGRYQPFHIGHLSVVDQMIKAPDVNRILIGIGSSEEANTSRNPFSFNERKEMISAVLADRTEKPWHIFGIPDVNDDKKWFQLVNFLAPFPFDSIYTDNDWVKRIYANTPIEIRVPTRKYDVCASKIRELIEGGGEYEDLIPDATLGVMKNIRGVQRINGNLYKYLNPAVTADIIINYANQGVVLIQRKEKPGDPNSLKWAIPGGHVDYGKETVEQAAQREAKEETNLDLIITIEDQFRQYSDPDRDPRGHYVTMVYHKLIGEEQLHQAQFGDDAVDIKYFPWDHIPKDLAFDHNRFLEEYIKIHIGRRRLIRV